MSVFRQDQPNEPDQADQADQADCFLRSYRVVFVREQTDISRPDPKKSPQIANEVGYPEKGEFEGLRERVEKVGGRIGNLIKVLKRGQ